MAEHKPALRDAALILDDEISTTQALSRFLEKSYQVFAAQSPHEYEEYLAKEPALIFCDLILPFGSGLDFLALARERSPKSARILISGHLDQETLLRAINQDLAHRVLGKPWTLEQLTFVAAEAYSVHRLLTERTYWEEVSLTDSLTRLWNRRGLLQNFLKELDRSRRHARPISLLMLDIDQFKGINDNRGHAIGDETLRSLAKIIQNAVRSVDWVCRYGGDEFMVLLPETNRHEALEVAERIRLDVEKKSDFTVSIGLAIFPYHGQDPAALIESADKALYLAKSKGRNQCVVAAYLISE